MPFTFEIGMTDIVDNAASESSDNEEINKLFPRCKPKISNDVNLNKVMASSLLDGTSNSHQYNFSTIENNGNVSSAKVDSIMMLENVGRSDLINITKANLENHCLRKMDPNAIDRMEHDACEEDYSVVSAYNTYTANQVPKNECNSDVVTTDDLLSGCCSSNNAGCHQEFKLRESRIEIAGGREIFSSSRNRLAKKKYNDENTNEKDAKRNDHREEKHNYPYRIRSMRTSSSSNNFSVPDAPMDSVQKNHSGGKDGTTVLLQQLHKDKEESKHLNINTSRQCNSLLMYETPLRGSKIIYDDIDDWTDPSPLHQTAFQMAEDGSSIQDGLDVICKPLTASTEALNSDDGMPSHEIRNKTVKKSSLDDSFASSNKLDIYSNNGASLHNDVSSCEEMELDTAPTYPRQKDKSNVIGSIPIAEYEGSPRRYGPRPGHPERIFTDDSPYREGKVELCNSMMPLKTEDEEEDELASTTAILNELHSLKVENDANKAASRTDDLFDQLFDQSQTQKVLTDFYKNDLTDPNKKDFNELEYTLYRMSTDNSYVGRRLAQFYGSVGTEESPKKPNVDKYEDLHHMYANSCDSSHESLSRQQQQQAVMENHPSADFSINNPGEVLMLRQHEEKNVMDAFDQDCETISTNPDTEDLGETEMGEQVGQSRNFTLSPETTDCDSNDVESEVSFENEDSLNSSGHAYGSMPVLEDGLSSGQASDGEENELENDTSPERRRHHSADNPTTLLIKKQISEIEKEIARCAQKSQNSVLMDCHEKEEFLCPTSTVMPPCLCSDDNDITYLDPLRQEMSPPPPAPLAYRKNSDSHNSTRESVDEAIKEIKQAIQRTKSIPMKTLPVEKMEESEDKPVWIPRPLFSQTGTTDDERKVGDKEKHDDIHEEELLTCLDCDTDQETDRLLGKQRSDDKGFFEDREKDHKKKNRSKEVLIHEPAVLIEGVLFRARYLGSTQLVCEGQPTKATRMMQAEEAVSRIKAPEGENQPSTDVDLFISTEKIMVLNTDLKEIMMDHSLRTISYIADIGDLVVLMARRRMMNCQEEQDPKARRTPKMICHVFESEEAQFIAQSIGQAFQVAYMEFLKANGIEDHSFVKEMDYQEVLNSQEIYGDELEMFAKKEMQKEVIVPKARGEILGVVIVESGWGSMLPTVVIANMSPSGAAARCGQVNIGDQIIAINGISLVGLPLSTCQNYIKNAKGQMVVKLTVVPCAPVVEVKIKRPDTKYQLGFSVQNGVICSLLRGGIAERGGVRVGHRIIEINGQSVVAVPHERIVNLLATSVGEILMKTMPTSMFRLLTGQETPVYI